MFAKVGKAGFRVKMKDFEIKKAAVVCLLIIIIKQIDSVAVGLFSNRSQRMSKCGKNISDTLGYSLCATSLFLLHHL